MRARQVLDEQLQKGRRGPLREGTVIVLNSGDDSESASGNGTAAALAARVQQLLREPGKGPRGQAAGDADQDDVQVVNSQSPASGKRWKFQVNRDPQGTITSVEAQEL